MSQIIGTNFILPIEIILNILYKYKGLEHPISKILKNDMKSLIKNKCFYCNKKDSLAILPISYFTRNTIFYKKKILNENVQNLFEICWNCAN